MTVMKSGDLVVLKSGGPIMTVDTVNTDIFDNDKITGVLCVWFVGEKLERVRFDHRAIEPASLPKTASRKKTVPAQEAAGDYKLVLDEMTAAMNVPADAQIDAPGIDALKTDAPRIAVKRSKPAAASKRDTLAPPLNVNGIAAR